MPIGLQDENEKGFHYIKFRGGLDSYSLVWTRAFF